MPTDDGNRRINVHTSKSSLRKAALLRIRATPLLACVLVAATMVVARPTAAPAQTCATRVLNVVAHYDDDLLFLSPDIESDVAAGRCVRTLFVTAADAGFGFNYVLGREAGIRTSYASSAGVTNAWTTLSTSGSTLMSLNANPRVQVQFLRIIEGARTGIGYVPTGNVSLMKVWNGTLASIGTLPAGGPSFTKASLIAWLGSVMADYSPNIIRIQAKHRAVDDPDEHSDHVVVAKFAYEAHLSYPQPHTIYWYEDYPIYFQPVNLTPAEIAVKSNGFLTYAPFDNKVCQVAWQCAYEGFDTYFKRRYLIGSEFSNGATDGTPIEAESLVTSGLSTFPGGGATGSGSIGGWVPNDSYLRFNVNAPSATTLRLRFRHSLAGNQHPAFRMLSVDGADTVVLPFGPTASQWGYTSYVLPVTAGNHVIQLTRLAGMYADIRIDHVIVEGATAITPAPTTTAAPTSTAAPTTTTTTTTTAPPNTLPPGTSDRLYNTNTTPAFTNIALGANYPVTTAQRINITCTGTINGLWWYRTPQDNGTNTALAWRNNTLLAQRTIDPGTTGWSYIAFPTPITVNTNDQLILGIHHPNGSYATQTNGFTNRTLTSPGGCLNSPATTPTQGNGLYRYTPTPALPDSSYIGSEYFITPDLTPGTPPTSTVAPTTTTTPPTTTTAPSGPTTTVPSGSVVAYVELEDQPNNLTFESAVSNGGTGRGSLGYWFYDGQYSRFTATIPTAGTYTVRYRYATPQSGVDRRLYVNGNLYFDTLAFASTGGWASWQNLDATVSLPAGSVTIELRTKLGGLNVDNATILTR